MSDSHGIGKDTFSCAAAPVEVVRRSGALGGTAIRSSAVHGSVCAVGAALGKSSELGSFENDGGLVDGMDGDVCSSLGRPALVTAVESERISGLLEVSEPVADCTAKAAGAAAARATAGESKGIIGSFQLSESDFPSLNSSCLGSLSSSCARRVACSAATASARVCPGSSYLAVSAVAHTHASILHGACYNSWSDTGGAQGPRGRKRVKEGVLVWRKICVLSTGGGRGKFSASRLCTGAGCWSLTRKATRHRCQAVKGRCGHTFPPPGGS